MTVKAITHKHANIYLIGGERFLLFDCGWQDSFPEIKTALREYGVGLSQIAGVFVSHFHPDHAGCVEVLRRHGVRPLILDFQMPYIAWLNDYFTQKKNDPRGDYMPLDPKDVLPLTLSKAREFLLENGFDGEILHTPGHSEDSISLLIGDSAFIGDMQEYSSPESFERLRNRGIKNVYAGHQVFQFSEDKNG